MNQSLHIEQCQSFFNHLEFEKRYSRHTLTAYRSDIDQFIQFMNKTYPEKNWKDIEHHDIRSWMIELVEGQISSRSIARKLSCLRKLFQFKKQRATIEKNPLVKIQVPKARKSLPETISKDRLERLFDTIDLGDAMEYRDRLILELFYTTGIRRSELIMLKDSDLDESHSRIKVLGKGNKERNIPLPSGLVDKICKWQGLRDNYFKNKNEGYLFVNDKGKAIYPKWIYNMVKSYLSGVTSQKKRSPHVLRHSFATHLMDAGAELNAVKELLGHSSLAATQVYTHNSIEKLKSVYKSAHPRSS